MLQKAETLHIKLLKIRQVLLGLEHRSEDRWTRYYHYHVGQDTVYTVLVGSVCEAADVIICRDVNISYLTVFPEPQLTHVQA